MPSELLLKRKPQSLQEGTNFLFGQIDYSAVQLKTRYQMEIDVQASLVIVWPGAEKWLH